MNPKLFISYCWATDDHQEWVLRLATELRESGVDVILDKWDLKEGNDANAFMERMVTDESVKKVILVIDEHYSSKADKREGGVGTETQIISAEVYESVSQNKFVAVIASRSESGQTKLPAFYKSRIYIDLSTPEEYGKNFEQLLRWVYDKPLHVKPELGTRPDFLDEQEQPRLGTANYFRRTAEAFRNNRPNAPGTLREYFDRFSQDFETFRIQRSDESVFDDQVIESIGRTKPARNELIEVISIVSQYDTNGISGGVIHRFLEKLLLYTSAPEGVVQFSAWDWDNFNFFIHETYLMCVAIFLSHERFDLAELIIQKRYYHRDDLNRNAMNSFSVFRKHIPSLYHRNERLQLRRLTLHADILKERCTDSGVSFESLMQADFFLYLAGALATPKEQGSKEWWPETLVYKTMYPRPFEIFLRAESTSYFRRMAPALGISDKTDIDRFTQELRAGRVTLPRWEGDFVRPLELMDYQNLCSRP